MLKIFSKFSNAVKGNFQYAQKINLLATFMDMAETSEDRAEFGLPGLDQFLILLSKIDNKHNITKYYILMN